MSQNDLFGIDDIFEDNKSKADFSALIGVIIRLILAVTTGGFFYLYVGDLFTWIAGNLYSPYLSAVTGVFCIDGLAYFWSKLRQRNGNTETQLTAATIGTIGNILISVLVTVVFIILMTDFVTLYDAAGQLNDIGQAVNIAGLLIATVAIGGNGVLWAYSDANSSAVRQALSSAKLGAARFAGQFAIDDRRNRLEIGRTIEQLQEALPQYTDNAAKRNRAQYLLNNFQQLDTDGDGRLSDNELAHLNGSAKRYEQTAPAPPRPATNRQAKRLRVYRQLPGQGKELFETLDTYQAAVDLTSEDGFKRPPGTQYWIMSGNEIINHTEVDAETHLYGHPTPLQKASNGNGNQFEIYIKRGFGKPEEFVDSASSYQEAIMIAVENFRGAKKGMDMVIYQDGREITSFAANKDLPTPPDNGSPAGPEAIPGPLPNGQTSPNGRAGA